MVKIENYFSIKRFCVCLVYLFFSTNISCKIHLSSELSSISFDKSSENTTRSQFRYTDGEQDIFLEENSHALNKLQLWFDNSLGNTSDSLKFGDPIIGGNLSAAYSANYYTDAQWSPDGEYLALVNKQASTTELLIYQLDTAAYNFTLLCQASFSTASISFCRWSPDGRYIALLARSGGTPAFTIYSFKGGRLTELEGCQLDSTDNPLTPPTWSSNGEFIAFSSTDAASDTVYLYKFDGIQLTEESFASSEQDPNHVDWSPSGKFLAVGSNSPLLRVYSIDADGSKYLASAPPDGTEDIEGLRWSPDGRFIAAITIQQSPDRMRVLVYRFGGNSLDLLDQIAIGSSVTDGAQCRVEWSPCGKYIAFDYDLEASTDSAIEVIKFDGERLTALHGCVQALSGRPVYGLSWNKKYPIISMTTQDSSNTYLYSFYFESSGKSESLEQLSGCSKVFSPGFQEADWSSDGRYLAVVGEYNSGDTTSGRVYELIGSSLVQRDTISHGSHLFGVGWHPSGKYLAVSGDDGTDSKNIRVFSFDGYDLSELSGCAIAQTAENLYQLDWHSSGNYLAVVGYDNLLKIYTFLNETLTAAGSYDASADLRCVKWHPSGTLLAVGGNSVLRVLKYDGSTINSTPVASFAVVDWVYDVDWKPDGKYLAFCGSSSLTYEVQVLSFSGSVLTELDDARLIVLSNGDYGIRWIKNGDYLVFTGTTTDYYDIETYQFINEKLHQVTDSCLDFNGIGMSIAYNPIENLVAIVHDGSPTDGYHLHVYHLDDGVTLQDRKATSESSKDTILSNIMDVSTSVTAHSNAVVQLKIENSVNLKGFLDSDQTGSNVLSDVAFNTFAWSDDGKYVAVGSDGVSGGQNIKIYTSDGADLTEFDGGTFDFTTTATVKALAWHPLGTYIAVASRTTFPDDSEKDEIRLLQLTSTGLEEIVGGNRVGSGEASNVETLEDLAWSPDGKFLASAGYGPSDQAKVYGFDNGYTLSELSSIAIDYGSTTTAYSIDWATTGTYSTIALAGASGESSDRVQLYSFEFDSLSSDSYKTTAISLGRFGACEDRYDVAWSDDGQYLAAVGGNGSSGAETMAFKYFPETGVLSHLWLCDFTHGGTLKSAAWNRDTSKLAVSGYTGEGGVHTRILDFKNSYSFDEVVTCSVSEEQVPVRYGDVITLKHAETEKFLASGYHEWYGSLPNSDGTWFIKQVSGVATESVRTKWIVKGAHAASDRWNCRIGDVVQHGDTVRLESVETRGNLFSDNNYLPPTSTPIGSYHWATSRYNFSSGQGISGSGDDFVLAIVGGSSGDILHGGDSITLQHNDYNTYYLYSHDVTFAVEDGGSYTEQEIATSTTAGDNRNWTISAVDPQGYRDVVDGGLGGGAARSVLFSPDGFYLGISTAPDDRGFGLKIQPLDFKSLKDYTLTSSEYPRLGVSDFPRSRRVFDDANLCQWSPSGTYLAVTAGIPSGSKVRVFEFDSSDESLRLVDEYDHQHPITSLDWHPTGNYVALGGHYSPGSPAYSLRVLSFDGSALAALSGCNVALTNAGSVDIAWHPTGDYLATTGESTLSVYSFASDALSSEDTFSHSSEIIDAVAWTPDGSKVAIAGSHHSSDSCNVRVVSFDGASLSELTTARYELGTVARAKSLAWSSDGTKLALAGWGADDGYEGRVLAFNGSTLADISGGGAKIERGDKLYKIAWWKNDSYVVTAGAKGDGYNVECYSFDGTTLSEVQGMRKDPGYSLGFSINPDETYMAVSTITTGDDYNVRIYPLHYETLETANSNALNAWDTLDTSVGGLDTLGENTSNVLLSNIDLYTENSNLLSTLSRKQKADSNAINKQNMEFGRISGLGDPLSGQALPKAPGNLGTVVWNSIGSYIATYYSVPGTGDYAAVYSFDGQEFEYVATSDLYGSSVVIQDMDWHNGGQYIAVCGTGTSNTVQIFELENGTLTKTDSESGGAADYDLSWHPDGAFLAVGGDSSVTPRVYSFDSSTGLLNSTAVATATHGADVYAVEWSADGRYLLVGGTASSGVSARIFEFDGQNTLTEQTDWQISTGGNIVEAKWRPDGSHVALLASGGGTLYVYSLDSAGTTQVDTVTGGSISGFSWSPDGRYLTHDSPTDGMKVEFFDESSLSTAVDNTNALWDLQGAFFSPGGGYILSTAPYESLGDYQDSHFVCYPVQRDSFAETNSWAIKSIDDDAATLQTLTQTNSSDITTAVTGVDARVGTAETDTAANSTTLLNTANTVGKFMSARSRIETAQTDTDNNSWALVSLDEFEVASSNAIGTAITGTALTPQTVTLNGVASQTNPLYDETIGSDTSGAKLFALAGTKPIAVPNSDKTVVCMIENTTDGTTVYHCQDVISSTVRDFGNVSDGAIAAIAGGVAGSDTYAFVAAYANGTTDFLTTGGTIRAFKRDTTNTRLSSIAQGSDKGVMKVKDPTPADAYKEAELFEDAYAGDGVSDIVGTDAEITIKYVKDMHWDPTLERLFIGLEIVNDNTVVAYAKLMGLLVGRIASATDASTYTGVYEGDLLIEGAVPLTAISSTTTLTNIVGMNSVNDLFVNKVRTMHTSCGGAYVIVQVDKTNVDDTNLSRKIFALPIVNGSSATDIQKGKLAKITASGNVYTADFDTPAGAAELLTGNHDTGTDDLVPAVVGGGIAVPTAAQESGSIVDIQVVGDTVFAASTSGGTGELGIFASTAIFSTGGTIQAWTPWERVGGIYKEVYNFTMDTANGNLWYVYKTTHAADTMAINNWTGGNATASNGMADLKTTAVVGIDAALPLTEGGVYSATHFGCMTPGLYNGVGFAGHSWAVFTGNHQVVAARTGGGDYVNAAPELLPTVPTDDYSATYVKEFTDAALDELGEIYCSEFSRDGDVADTGWLFVGGQNGLAVWSVDATGAGWAAGSGLANVAGLGTATFKRFTDLPGPVYAMRSDGVYLYVMTDKKLYRITLAADKFTLATPQGILSDTNDIVMYECAADEWMLCMEAVAGSNDTAAVGARGYIATTKGLYYRTDWNGTGASYDTTAEWMALWHASTNTVTLPTGMGPVLGMKFLKGADAAATGSVVGNLYVLVGSLVQDAARLYRYAVKGTMAASNGLVEVTVLDDSGTEIFTVSDTTGLQTNFGGLRYNNLISGVALTGLSKHLGNSTFLKTYPVSTSTTPTQTDALFDLALEREPMYFADLVHNPANGCLIAAGNWGVRFLE
ncbi:hypothetical protein ACFLY6_02830 [Candidatus Dependentiae bacterium]